MRTAELEALRRVAASAVQAGMDVVREWRIRGDDLGARRISSLGSRADQYVTAVDGVAKRAILAVLGRGHDWVIDPIDGTTNFVDGDSFVGVSVALLEGGRHVVGATGCPFTGELWSAAEGLGAYDQTGRRLNLADRRQGARRVALDPADSGSEHLATWSEVRRRLTEAFEKVEPRSAIALELAYVAAGCFDGVVQVGGSPVEDFAAGALLIREAGGLVAGLDGRVEPWLTDIVVAGTRQTYDDLCDVLRGLGN